MGVGKCGDNINAGNNKGSYSGGQKIFGIVGTSSEIDMACAGLQEGCGKAAGLIGINGIGRTQARKVSARALEIDAHRLRALRFAKDRLYAAASKKFLANVARAANA